MLYRLLIPLAQGKASNTSKNPLNKILKIIYSLNQAEGITKKVYNKKINLGKV